jgi:hypothetical protein
MLQLSPTCPPLVEYDEEKNKYRVNEEEKKVYNESQDIMKQLAFWKELQKLAPTQTFDFLGHVEFYYTNPNSIQIENQVYVRLKHTSQKLLLYVSYLIHGTENAHANWMLIDHKEKTIEMFEPWGSQVSFLPQDHLAIMKKATQLLITQIDMKELSSYKLIPPTLLCPIMQGYKWQIKLPLCFYYGVLYMFLRVTCPTLTRDAILKMFSNMAPQQHATWLNYVHCLIQSVAKGAKLIVTKSKLGE